MRQFFTLSVLTATVASGIRLSTPFLLASLGETMGQRSGVLNLGVDGIMLLGAFGAYYTELHTHNLVLAVLVGALVGLIMGLVTAVVSVTFKAEQGISGIGVFLFGLGMSDLLFQKLVGTPIPVSTLPTMKVPGLASIPTVGKMFFQANLLAYLAFLLVPVLAFVLYRTTYGMKVQAVGENPAAADSLGVSVARIRYSAVLTGSTLAGVAGAALALQYGTFQQNLTQGQGFIAVALVYFGAWRPAWVMAGSLLYGMVAATVLTWNTLGIIPRSASNLAAMAPAVITVAALVVVARRFRQPAALARPYERGG
ncbi:MAG TPA: ABC transporter permease [Actinomycetota bacterium]